MLTASIAAAQGGNDCASAAASPLTLPFSGTNLTNCGSGNNYTALNATPCGSTLYLGGQDRLYAFTPDVSGLVSIVLTSNSSWVGLFLYEGCPQGGSCVGNVTGFGGSPNMQVAVTAGVTYYLMVDSWPAPDCHSNYNLTISEPGAFPPPNSQDCFGAIPVCQGIYQEANSPVGEGNYPEEINSAVSCLGGGEVAGQWYVFTVQNSGLVAFSIIPNNMANDYDWALYNLTGASCTDIFNNAALEVSCNFSGLAGVTGANGLPGAQNNPPIPVQTGQTYVLYVSNWSQSPFGYTLNFDLPNATASIFDVSPPTLSGDAQVNCTQDEVVIQFDEFVDCLTVLPTDFILTGPGGPYTITSIFSPLCDAGGNQDNTFTLTIAPPMTQAGDYTLEMTGDVLDLCGNIGNAGSLSFTLGGVLVLDATSVPAGCGGNPNGQVIGVGNGGQAPLTYSLSGISQVGNGTFTGLAAGSYTLTLTDAANCSVSIDVDVAESNTDVSLDALVTDATCNGSADGSITAVTTGNGGPWNYTWTDGGGTVVQSTQNSNGDVFTGGAGTYTVIVIEGANGNGCSDTLTATIAQPVPLTISVSDDVTICLTQQGTISAEAQGGTEPVALNWSGGLIGNGPHQVSPATNTTYSVQAVDANGCTSETLSIVVDVLPALQFQVPDSLETCGGIPITVNATGASGGNGQYQYDWGFGAQGAPSNTYTLTNSQNVCVTMTDGCSSPPVTRCTYIEVLAIPELVLTADSTEGCRPFLVNFTVQDTTGGAQVVWNFGDGSTINAGPQVAHTYSSAGLFSVSVNVTWPNGCQDELTVPDMVAVLQVPAADFTWSPQPISVLAPQVQFFEQAGPGAVTFLWDFYGTTTSDAPNPQHTFPGGVGDSYPVQLTVYNALGCADSIMQIIDVRDEFLVFVPNAFTPNGDGINDLFFVSGNDIDTERFELTVFNRWGEIVFSTVDRFQAWNGGMNNSGEAVQEGVYVWQLKARSEFTRQTRTFSGHVTLLK